MTNNLKAERTIPAENRVSDKRLAQMIDDANLQYLAAGYPDFCAIWQDRIDAFTELQFLRSQSLSTQQPMGEVTHSPPDVDNRPFCDCHQEYGEGLIEALQWYGEQARLCRLIHSEGDAGRYALSADGGKRAKVALHPNQESGE